MKRYFWFLSCLSAAMTTAWAASPADHRLEYLEGSYVVIGRHPDSERPYAGRVIASLSDQGLKLIRVVNGRSIEAKAEMDTATPDKIPVLRIGFKEHGKQYEEVCMVSVDLDNYPRVSCYLYHGLTKRVGLETWFPDHGQLIRP